MICLRMIKNLVVERKKDMKIFESKIYAKNGKGCLPFRIIIEENNDNNRRKVEVKRIEYSSAGDRMVENVSPLFAAAWTEEKPEVLSLATDGNCGSALMFDFAEEFLEIMKSGGKTVLFTADEESGESITEAWILSGEKYVCENNGKSLSLEEFVEYMDKDEYYSIEVLMNGETKISVLPLP